jgi:hypothetical protein
MDRAVSPPLFPHSPEAEKALLGAILVGSAYLEWVSSTGVLSESFYNYKHKLVFEHILKIHALELPIELVTVVDSFAHLRYLTPPYCLPVRETPSASRISVFGAHYPACIYPCPTLRVPPRGCPRMVRVQDGSLRLSCMTLSFTAPRRFIRTLTSPKRIRQAHLPDESRPSRDT